MPNTSLLLAFGFSNLAMLGWLAAAAAPLLIHLWSRHRYREVPWAAVHFLLAAMRKNARRLQVQQWLLLAVRTLIIVLVVVAVAEPYREGLLAGGSNATPTHKILAIDNSSSMAYRDGDAILLSRAKQLAAELVRASSPGDLFTVIQMAAPARTIGGAQTIDRAAVFAQIDALPQAHTGADLAATPTLIAELLDEHQNARGRVDRHEVYFFTDLQRVTWATAGDTQESEDGTADIRQRIAAMAERAALTIIDLAPPRRSNLAVTRLTTSAPLVTLANEVAFEATLHQFGDEPRPQTSVELLVDGVPVAEQTVDVPAGGEATVRFTHRFRAPGSHAVTVRAGGDALDLDNVRSLAVPVAEEIRVLCIAGRDGAARYIARALRPDPTDASPIRPIVVSEGDLAELNLAEFDAVFMCNVAQLTPREAARLARYSEQGGGVVFFLGDRVLPEQYNTVASQRARESIATGSVDWSGESPAAIDSRRPFIPLLPARLAELVSDPQFGVDPLGYRHPIVAPFRGRERAGLLTTPVSRYYRLEVPADRPDVEVVLELPNGDPLIVAQQLGRGRVILVATDGSLASVDPSTGEPWTAWPIWPSFLPIVRELLNFAAGTARHEWQQRIGTPIAGVALAPPGDVVEVTRPDGRTDAVRATSTAAGWEWGYDHTDLSGVYTAAAAPQRSSANAAQQLFAVNVDPRQSDLAKVDPDELPPELRVRDTWQSGGGRSTAGIAARSSWHGPLLWAAFGLVLAESLLAWRFGREIV